MEIIHTTSREELNIVGLFIFACRIVQSDVDEEFSQSIRGVRSILVYVAQFSIPKMHFCTCFSSVSCRFHVYTSNRPRCLFCHTRGEVKEHSHHQRSSCLYRGHLERFAPRRLLRGVRGVRGTSRNLREAGNLILTNVLRREVAIQT